jgi:hypothetical protein
MAFFSYFYILYDTAAAAAAATAALVANKSRSVFIDENTAFSRP